MSRKLAVVIIVLAVVIYYVLWRDFAIVDGCLDAGGAWNEQEETCHGARY